MELHEESDTDWRDIYEDEHPGLFNFFQDVLDAQPADLLAYQLLIRPPPSRGMPSASRSRTHLWELLYLDTGKVVNSKKLLAYLSKVVNRELPYTEYFAAIEALLDIPFLAFALAKADPIFLHYIILSGIGNDVVKVEPFKTLHAALSRVQPPVNLEMLQKMRVQLLGQGKA